MKRVKLENIVFLHGDDYNEMCKDLNDDYPNDDTLFDYLYQWWFPGEHEESWYDSEDINTEFLGYEYRRGNNTFLLSHNGNLEYAGLSRILGYEE